MYKLYTSAVELLDVAAEKYGERVAFRDAADEITFSGLQSLSRRLATALMKKTDTGRTRPVMVYKINSDIYGQYVCRQSVCPDGLRSTACKI